MLLELTCIRDDRRPVVLAVTALRDEVEARTGHGTAAAYETSQYLRGSEPFAVSISAPKTRPNDLRRPQAAHRPRCESDNIRANRFEAHNSEEPGREGAPRTT